jgi:hypothetical protein
MTEPVIIHGRPALVFDSNEEMLEFVKQAHTGQYMAWSLDQCSKEQREALRCAEKMVKTVKDFIDNNEIISIDTSGL